MTNHLKKMFTIALVTCFISTPASAMDAPKVAIIEAARTGNLKKVNQLIKKDNTCVNKANENGVTALIVAAEHGHLDCIQALINAGAQVDQARKKDGATALMFLAEHGRADCLKVLIATGAQVDQTDKKSVTPLIRAALKGHLPCVQALIDAKANVEQRSEEGTTALLGAALYGHTDCVQALIAAGAEVDQTNKDGATALLGAAFNGHTDCIQALIAAEADTAYALRYTIRKDNCKSLHNLLNNGIDVNMPITSRNETALYQAAKKGNQDIVLLLLQNKANANQARSDGVTPLMIAAQKGHGYILDILIKFKCPNAVDINTKAAGYQNVSALYLAAQNRKQDVVELLLKNSANANITADNGWTPLMAAAVMGHTEIVKLLLQYGADHRLTNEKGYTAHDFALRKNHTSICELLESKNRRTEKSSSVQNNNMDAPKVAIIEAARTGDLEKVNQLIEKDNTCVNKANENGVTALKVAAEHGHLDCIKALIKASAQVDQTNKNGVTALMGAALNGKQDAVDLLLRSGANANIAANNGWTPLMAAAFDGHEIAVSLLLFHGADHTLKSVKGYTAHDFALRKNHTSICELLESKNRRTEKSSSVQNNNNE